MCIFLPFELVRINSLKNYCMLFSLSIYQYHINRSVYNIIELYVKRINTFETNSDQPIPPNPIHNNKCTYLGDFPKKISDSRAKNKKQNKNKKHTVENVDGYILLALLRN